MTSLEKFARLLDRYMTEGCGRVTAGRLSGSWSDRELSESMVCGNLTCTSESVRGWKLGHHLPQEDMKNLLVGVLFPAAEQTSERAVDKSEFERSWTAANTLKKTRQVGAASTDGRHPNLDWVIKPGKRTYSLAELSVEAPLPTNEPNRYNLKLTLVISRLETEYLDLPVEISMRHATLSVTSNSFQMIPGPNGFDSAGNLNLRRSAHGFEVVGPSSCEGKIDGVVSNGESLTHIERVGASLDPIYISLTAVRRSFVTEVFEAQSNERKVSVNKLAVLNAVLYEHLDKDTAGRAVVASVALIKTEQREDDK